MTASHGLNDRDIEILRILNGEDVPGWSWGAAMSVCCETLCGKGYAVPAYKITEKGKELLEELGYGEVSKDAG